MQMSELNRTYDILRVLKRVKEAMRQNVEKQCCVMKLTAPQGMLVGILAHFGEMKIGDLSEKMGLSNSTVSGIIDRLEVQGFVIRTRSEDDRRIVMVNLSPDFHQKMDGKFQMMDEHLSQIISVATPEELDVIYKGMKTLDDVIIRSNAIKHKAE